jgi:hypothetical protein
LVVAEEEDAVEAEAPPVGAMRLRWDFESAPVTLLANQFALQRTPGGEILLLVGQVAPPLLIGDMVERTAQAEALAGKDLPVRVLARFALTPNGFRELAALLGQGQQHLQLPPVEKPDRD